MKRRVLTMAVALLLLMSMAGPALAADMTGDGDAGTTIVNFTVGTSFTVTIPDGPIAVTTAGIAGGSVATTAGGTIPVGKKLVITATSANPGAASAFQVKSGSNLIVYTVQKDNASGDAIVSGGTVMEVTAANLNSQANAQPLFFKLTGAQVYAGSYTDTITFSVVINDAP